MLDNDFINKKIDLIREDLENLREFGDKTFDEAASDPMKWAALERFYARAIGRGIDINRHILSEFSDSIKRAPDNYHETFTFLSRIGVLPKDFAEEIAKSAGFRNKIIHEYNDLDEALVFETVEEAVGQYARYCEHILDFVDEQKDK